MLSSPPRVTDFSSLGIEREIDILPSQQLEQVTAALGNFKILKSGLTA